MKTQEREELVGEQVPKKGSRIPSLEEGDTLSLRQEGRRQDRSISIQSCNKILANMSRL